MFLNIFKKCKLNGIENFSKGQYTLDNFKNYKHDPRVKKIHCGFYSRKKFLRDIPFKKFILKFFCPPNFPIFPSQNLDVFGILVLFLYLIIEVIINYHILIINFIRENISISDKNVDIIKNKIIAFDF